MTLSATTASYNSSNVSKLYLYITDTGFEDRSDKNKLHYLICFNGIFIFRF